MAGTKQGGRSASGPGSLADLAAAARPASAQRKDTLADLAASAGFDELEEGEEAPADGLGLGGLEALAGQAAAPPPPGLAELADLAGLAGLAKIATQPRIGTVEVPMVPRGRAPAQTPLQALATELTPSEWSDEGTAREIWGPEQLPSAAPPVGEAELFSESALVPLDERELALEGERTSPSFELAAPAPASEHDLPLATAADQIEELAGRPELYEPPAPPAAPPRAEEPELLVGSGIDQVMSLGQPQQAPPVPQPDEHALPLSSAADQIFELGGDTAASRASGLAAVPTGASLELADEALPPRDAPRGTIFGEAAPAIAVPPPAPATLPATVAPPPPPPRPVTPDDRATEEITAELFRHLEKVVKLLNLYEGRGEACERTLAQAGDLLRSALARGPLRFRVTPYEFMLGEQPVYVSQEDRKGLSYRLFRDGVRELELMPGLEAGELRTLIEIMQSQGRHLDEDDSVTLLWNADLPHVRYMAIDVFLEGLLDTESLEQQQQVSSLVSFCLAPVHAEALGGDLRESLARMKPAALEQARSWRQRLLAALPGDPALTGAEVEGLSRDLWRRTAAIIDELKELCPSEKELAGLIAGILEELWQEGRWETLGEAAAALADLGAGGQVGVLREGMTRLASAERLLTLTAVLETGTATEVKSVFTLVRILPESAYRVLIQVLVQLPASETQERLAALLGELGADLGEWHRRRLRSENVAQVLAAIAALKESSDPHALDALRPLLAHKSPRVQLEALRVFAPRLTEADVPALLGALRVDSRELQDLSCQLLERLPGRKHAARLVEALKESEADEWPPARRRRLLLLLVRWGGTEANDFIIKRIVTLNPFRRARIESQRHEMLEVVQQAGGRRAQQLLTACLDSRPPEAARMAIATALKALEASS